MEEHATNSSAKLWLTGDHEDDACPRRTGETTSVVCCMFVAADIGSYIDGKERLGDKDWCSRCGRYWDELHESSVINEILPCNLC